jgi:hypothetical protein
MSDNNHHFIGRVLRASTRGYDCGTHSNAIGVQHDFGAFVKAPVANEPGVLSIGLIYRVEIKDDQLITELVMGESVNHNVLRDQRENRMVPVEIRVLNIGYIGPGYIVHSLPPRPPMSLSDVVLCTMEEVYHFTRRQDFFRLVLSASEAPADDLIAAAIRYAASIYEDPNERYTFLVMCGRELARELASDLKRLSHILTLMRP